MDFPRNISYASVQFQKMHFSLCTLGTSFGNYYDICTSKAITFQKNLLHGWTPANSHCVMLQGCSHRPLQKQGWWEGSISQTKHDVYLLHLICVSCSSNSSSFSSWENSFPSLPFLFLPPYLKILEINKYDHLPQI